MDNEFSNEKDFIRSISNSASRDEKGFHWKRPEKEKLVDFVYRAMLYFAKGDGIKVEKELNKPYVSMGAVSVVGKEIMFDQPEIFAMVAGLASNFEIYPKIDGTVQMNFTFHNLTRKVGD